jgi:hypothetical protein
MIFVLYKYNIANCLGLLVYITGVNGVGVAKYLKIGPIQLFGFFN